VTVNVDDLSLKLRLNKVDFGGNNVVSCEAVAEDEIVYLSNSTGSGGNLPASRRSQHGANAAVPHGFAHAAL
jgi:hypothetical protein